jgi:hypothetical protein
MEQQEALGLAYDALVQLEVQVQVIFDAIVASDNVEVTLALVKVYEKALLAVAPERTASLLRESVVALEKHISSKSGQSINDWLYTRELKVTQSFAALSSIVSETIQSENIEP